MPRGMLDQREWTAVPEEPWGSCLWVKAASWMGAQGAANHDGDDAIALAQYDKQQ